MESLKVYLAAPFFNEHQLCNVKRLEAEMDSAGVGYYSPRSEGVLLDLTEEERQKRKADIYQKNVDNIDSCTHMIAIIDDRDIGTIWEMGYAVAKKIPVITLSNQDYGLNVMIAESVQAHTLSVKNAVDCLFNKSNTGVLVKDVY